MALLEAEQEAIRQAASFASASVVQIETFGGMELVDQQRIAVGASTGTVVGEDGWIVTSLFNLRSQPAAINVILPSGERLTAKLVARDHSREYALLKVQPNTPLVPAVASGQDTWQVGQWTTALGKTFHPKSTSHSVGILSALGRVWDKAIQTDAKISPLNYGGPLVDLHGRVMGILVPINPGIATEGEVEQWYDSGIGFAIPLADILARLPRMKEGNDIYPGKLGIRPKARDDFAGPVVLAGVSPGSPAIKAGLMSGDTIVRVNGREVPKLNVFRHAMGPLDAETTVELDVIRKDQPVKVQVKLVKEVPVYQEPYLGIVPSLDQGRDGLMLGAIIKGSPAERAGLKVSQRIVGLEGKTITTLEEWSNQLSFLDFRTPITLSVADPDEPSQQVRVNLSVWPAVIPESVPTLPPRRKTETTPVESRPDKPPELATGIIQVPLGDVQNKCFAYIPPRVGDGVPHGCMIVLPEAGPTDQKPWVDAWEPFCREHRWMLVVLQSVDAKRWMLEELELVIRLLHQIQTDYPTDSRRRVLGGVGSGGTLALVASVQNRKDVRGAWFMDSRIPPGLRLTNSEPMESMHWLMIGQREEYPRLAKSLKEIGHHSIALTQAVEVDKPWSGAPLQGLQRWLQWLEAF
jgi:serine protease Do